MIQPASRPKETFGNRAREILLRGQIALGHLPAADDLQKAPPDERREALNRLRVELYALSSIIADETVGRSFSERSKYPPYGLLRSLFTDFGVVSASPSPLSEGSITDFRHLGKALIDTVVFHLDAYLKELRSSDRRWMFERLGRQLSVFRLSADRKAQARMRDPFSFIYGGLQFGTSTCVQLVEVMTRLLGPSAGLSRQNRVDLIKRSIRPAYDLASLNVEDVAAAYAKLQPPGAGPDAGSPQNPAGWMDTANFLIKHSDEGPWRVVLAFNLAETAEGEAVAGGAGRLSTQGCPARSSPAGTRSPIGRLWEWSVELADEAGLIKD